MAYEDNHIDYRAFKTPRRQRIFTYLYLVLFGVIIGVALTKFLRPLQKPAGQNNLASVIANAQPTPPTLPLDVTVYEKSVIEATRKSIPAVVTVFSTGLHVRQYRFNNPLMDMFWGPQIFRKPVTGVGSGVIVDQEGTIYTNDHVISVQNALEIRVVLPDGRSFKAELVKHFPIQDIAILSIDGDNLPYIKIGSSDNVVPGQTVLAIGNPFGIGLTDGLTGGEPTVTRGIISATRRPLTISQRGQTRFYRNMLQTDASINEGNSGGALIDINGKLIGINTAIMKKGGGGSIGIGFAIPIDRILFIIESSEKYDNINDWNPGIEIEPLTDTVAEALNYDGDGGVLISKIERGGTGEKSGLKRGDIIIGINGFNVTSTKEVRGLFHGFVNGETLRLTVFRKGEKLDIDLLLEPMKK